MRCVNGNHIKLGERVMLTNPDPEYTLGYFNPAKGTRWECEGEYIGSGRVRWATGKTNSYSNNELSKVNNRIISIW